MDAKGEEDKPKDDGSDQAEGAASASAKEKPSVAPKDSTDDGNLAHLMKSLGLGTTEKRQPVEQVLDAVSVEGIANYIKSGKCKKIITMAGAGISTSAGIPDFRSPGSGLYDNLQQYDLPDPQAIFDIDFFKEKPEPFYMLAKNLWPGVFKPTPCHYFVQLLQSKGLLLRHFTQNIDTLERIAGIPPDKIVEAHGTFATGHCVICRQEYTQDWIKEKVFADTIPRCTTDDCAGLVKPDIIFFGESLPSRFFQCVQQDIPDCDLLVIMGTSLVVQPFASLTSRVADKTPRLYINLEAPPSGGGNYMMAMLGYGHGFNFEGDDNYRDVFWKGTCDDGCRALADLLGWGEELKTMVETAHSKIDAESAKQKATEHAAKDSSKADTPTTEVKKSPSSKPGMKSDL